MIEKNSFQAKLLTFLILYVSGSIFCTSYYYKQSVIITFAVVLVFMLANGRLLLRIRRQKLTLLILLVLFVGIMLFIQRITTFSSYIAIILQLLISLMISEFIDRKVFCTCFVAIMSMLATISIVCFSVYLVYPNIALIFPKIDGISSLDYYFAGLYVFPSSLGFGYFIPFYRNCSIFWEPGAYQAFLNMALYLQLAMDDGTNKKRSLFRIFVFVLSVITTLSTTGYIILAIILIMGWKKISLLLKESKVGFRVIMFVLMAVSVVFVFRNGLSFDFLTDKVAREFGEEMVVLSRLGLSDVLLFTKDITYLLGMSFETYYLYSSGTGNSLIQTMVTLGIPFTAILVGMYYRFSAVKNKSFLLFLILIMMFSSESLIWRPFFLCFAWYGIGAESNKDGKVTEIENTVGY